VSEEVTPAQAGWYPLPRTAQEPLQVGYWDGAAWTGAKRRGSTGGRAPRDTFGIVALILLGVGFFGTILVGLGSSALSSVDPNLPSTVFTASILLVLAASPAALVVSIVGLAHGHALKFLAPVSLASMILAVLGTVILALPIALFVTGVWILPHI
jgi:hypothetical protein